MFNTENEAANLNALYGEHKHSIPDVDSNETIHQKELNANYTRDLTHAKDGFVFKSLDFGY